MMNGFSVMSGVCQLMALLILYIYVFEKAKQSNQMRYFFFGQATIFIWIFFDLFVYVVPNIGFYFHLMSYLGICLIGYTQLNFTYLFTSEKTLSKEVNIGLTLASTLSYLIVLTNPLHHMYYKAYERTGFNLGILGYLIVGYNIILIIYAMIVLLIKVKKEMNDYKKQQGIVYTIILISLLIAYIINLIGDIPIFLWYPIGLFILNLLLIKYRFLDLLTFSNIQVLNHIDTSIWVFDTEGNIRYNNMPLLNDLQESVTTLQELIDALQSMTLNNQEWRNIKMHILSKKQSKQKGILILDRANIQYLRYSIIPLGYEASIQKGYFCLFEDISEIITSTKRLKSKNKRLEQKTEYLKEQLKVAGEIVREQKKHQLMQEVETLLSEELTELLNLEKDCRTLCDGENEETIDKKVNETLDYARECLQKIRQVVNKYKRGEKT